MKRDTFHVTMYYMRAFAATFTPEDMMAMWGVTQNEWRSLQQRKLVDSTEKTHGNTKRTVMDIWQAIALGMQMDLVKKVGLSYADAQALVHMAKEDVTTLFESGESFAGRAFLYAVTASGPTGKPAWIPITPDSFLGEVDSKLGSAWAVLDVGHYLRKVDAELDKRDPEYRKWRARLKARVN